MAQKRMTTDHNKNDTSGLYLGGLDFIQQEFHQCIQLRIRNHESQGTNTRSCTFADNFFRVCQLGQQCLRCLFVDRSQMLTEPFEQIGHDFKAFERDFRRRDLANTFEKFMTHGWSNGYKDIHETDLDESVERLAQARCWYCCTA